MITRERFRALFLAGIAIAAMVLLSAGISGLDFSGGQLISLGRAGGMELGRGGAAREGDFLVTVLLALFTVSQVLFPFAIIYFVISGDAKKRVLRALGHLLWLIALYLLLRSRINILDKGRDAQSPAASPPNATIPEIEFIAAPPQWFVLTMSFAIAVLLASLAIGVIWFFWHRRRRPTNPLEQLAQEAQDALDALRAGSDLKNTVMRCYLEMSRVLSEQRGIKREKAMTTREFERHLAATGLPSNDVRGLTRLFEGVRYGGKVPGDYEERQAVACLTAIIKACGSAA